LLHRSRKFQLDAAVAAEGVLGGSGIDRLELAEAGGDQALPATRLC